ncbi:hypothetical protein SAMN05216232_3761 [Virgibacillus subterraneus]|uniref:DUF4179 domain-containing protein n=1 Tax=Virgibacillus subterraneus TaxID=621109 RepID=A0A1H9K6E2_9BACI|nr:hypothetical protein [Virgibacillus subterraneus]SEQ94689.1 hypothetical protein SAMN05216232_3761 [Virgibacillus subterraneus]
MNRRVKKSLNKYMGEENVFTEDDKRAIQMKIAEGHKPKKNRIMYKSIGNGFILACALSLLIVLINPFFENTAQDYANEDEYFTFQLGEKVWDRQYKTLFFGDPIQTPPSLDTTKIEEGMEVLTIPITFTSTFTGVSDVNPLAFDLVSSNGEEMNPYDTKIIENDGWKSGIIRGGGSVTFANTYVFPKNEGWHIEFEDWYFVETFDRYYIVKFDE